MGVTRAHGTTNRHGGTPAQAATRAATRKPLRLAPASRALVPSPTLEINEAIAARRAAGRDVLHLGFGEASFPLPPKVRTALADSATRTSYEPVVGIPALRATIAEYLGRTRGLKISAEQVIVAPGSKPLLFALMQVLAGDVMAPAPAWVSYAPQARLAGRRMVIVETDPEDAHRLTPRALDGALAQGRHDGADPRILIVNSPSNPTGGMFAREDVEAVADWARRSGVTILSDEIYAELAHGWRPHISPFLFYPEGTVVTGGLSKTYSVGGWRLGYAVVPDGDAGAHAALGAACAGERDMVLDQRANSGGSGGGALARCRIGDLRAAIGAATWLHDGSAPPIPGGDWDKLPASSRGVLSLSRLRAVPGGAGHAGHRHERDARALSVRRIRHRHIARHSVRRPAGGAAAAAGDEHVVCTSHPVYGRGARDGALGATGTD